MDDQQIFDTVAKHLLEQGEKSEGPDPSSDDGTTCLYRGPNGLKCAAGCLIPDEMYSPKLEGLNVNAVTMRKLFEAIGITSIRLVRDFQIIHDVHAAKDWPDCLRRLAKNRRLSPAVLED